MSSKAEECIRTLAQAENSLLEPKRYAIYKNMKNEESFYDENLLRILMFGRFKSGKSSLINALAGSRVAAVDYLEKTSWVARYWPSDEEFCNVILKDGSTSGYDVSEFLEKTENDEWQDDYLSQIRRIDVGYKPDGNGISYGLIDTPGFGADPENENRALEALKDADLVFYVVDIEKSADQRAQAVVSTIRERGIPMICVANKYDGDIEHQKSETDTVKMVSDHSGFSEEDIYLLSVKNYMKGKDKAQRMMSALRSRIQSSSVINSDLRKQARSASNRNAEEEESKLLLTALVELLTIVKERTNLEYYHVYNQHMVKTELKVELRDYVKSTLCEGYRDKIISSMSSEAEKAKAESRQPDLSKAIQDTLPQGYMDSYWETVKAEAKKKSALLWENRQGTGTGTSDSDKLIEELKNSDIDVSFSTEGINAYSGPGSGAALSGMILDKTFTAAGFASVLSIAMGASLGGALLLVGAPIAIFGLWLSEKVKSNQERSAVFTMDDILDNGISQFAETLSGYAVDGLTKNGDAILQKRLEKFDNEYRKRLPKTYDYDLAERLIREAIDSIPSAGEESDDIQKLRALVTEFKNSIDRSRTNIEAIRNGAEEEKKEKEKAKEATLTGRLPHPEKTTVAGEDPLAGLTGAELYEEFNRRNSRHFRTL